MAQTSGNGPLGWCGIRASRPTAEAGSNSLQCCLIATPSTFGLLRTELGIDWPAPVRLKFQVSISGDGHDCGITVGVRACRDALQNNIPREEQYLERKFGAPYLD